MPIYIYGCSQGHRSERIVPVGTATMACTTCDEQDCGRVYSYTVAITRPEADTRGMFRRYQEASAEMNHTAERIEANTGSPVSPPNVWKTARARAQAMTAAGENTARRTW